MCAAGGKRQSELLNLIMFTSKAAWATNTLRIGAIVALSKNMHGLLTLDSNTPCTNRQYLIAQCVDRPKHAMWRIRIISVPFNSFWLPDSYASSAISDSLLLLWLEQFLLLAPLLYPLDRTKTLAASQCKARSQVQLPRTPWTFPLTYCRPHICMTLFPHPQQSTHRVICSTHFRVPYIQHQHTHSLLVPNTRVTLKLLTPLPEWIRKIFHRFEIQWFWDKNLEIIEFHIDEKIFRGRVVLC